jgi:hypothetical protein
VSPRCYSDCVVAYRVLGIFHSDILRHSAGWTLGLQLRWRTRTAPERANSRSAEQHVNIFPVVLATKWTRLSPVVPERVQQQFHRLHKPIAPATGYGWPQEPFIGRRHHQRLDANRPPQHAQTRGPPQHGGNALPDPEGSQLQTQPSCGSASAGLCLQVRRQSGVPDLPLSFGGSGAADGMRSLLLSGVYSTNVACTFAFGPQGRLSDVSDAGETWPSSFYDEDSGQYSGRSGGQVSEK